MTALLRGLSFCFWLSALGCRDSVAPNGQSHIVWHASGGDFSRAPAARDSTVFFPTQSHEIVALDVRTGAIRWRAPTHETRTGLTGGANAVVVAGVVVVPDVSLYAFDPATGAPKWRFEPMVGGPPGFFNVSTDGVCLFAGSHAGYAYAVDAATGTQRWATRIATDSGTSDNVVDPVVDRGVVYVAHRRFTNPTTGGIVAIDAETGAIRWRREFEATATGQGSAAYGRVALWNNLVIAAADDGRVYGLDRATGAIVWMDPRPVDEPALNDFRPLVLSAGTIVVASTREKLTGLDPATGAQRWEVASRYGGTFFLSADESRVYSTNFSLELGVLDAATGTLLWSIVPGAADRGFTSHPVASGGLVFVPGVHGFWALRP